MSYRVRLTGDIKTKSEIKKLNPNISLPKTWGLSVYEALGIDPIYDTNTPEPSSDDKEVIRNGVEQNDEGNWVYAYTEVNKYASEKEKTTALEAAERAKAQGIRNKRNNLLAKTDWRACSDLTLSTEWTNYRQALRDVPAQDGFPYTVTWPDEP